MRGLLCFFGLFVIAVAPTVFAAEVSVRRVEREHWELIVDGQPFAVQGVGCNEHRGQKGEKYLRMAKELGANALRTWGDTSREYLDAAEKEGLLVDVGLWVNPIRSGSSESFQDGGYRAGLKNQIMSYVREFKNHPAVLSWNLGNEVFAFTESDVEKAAVGHFLNAVIQAIHAEDPHHPVTYASASTKDLVFLKKYVPELDIVGVNIYGSLSPVLGWMRENRYDKPFWVTEFGPLGSWDQSKDANSLPFDPLDQVKAENYESLWRQISAEPERCLGGFAFLLGEQRNQDSLTWYNLNWGEEKREGFWTVRRLYTGQRPKNRVPKISGFRVHPSTGLVPGSDLDLEVAVDDPDNDSLKFRFFLATIASDPLIVEKVSFVASEVHDQGDGKATLKAPDYPGQFRIYAEVRDGNENVALANRSIEVFPRKRTAQAAPASASHSD